MILSNGAKKDWFERMLQEIEEDLPDVPKEQLLKDIAAIYRSIQRCTVVESRYSSLNNMSERELVQVHEF